jgi:P27 family predicted phage terminase small subunit
MRGGHNALSTTELQARGTYKAARHRDRLENHTTTVGTLEPPEHLDGEQKEKFLEVCDHLAGFGVLSPADRDGITTYVETLDLQNKARQAVQKYGAMIELEGKTATNPAARLYLQCEAVLKPLRERFGFDPKSRQGLKTKPAIKAKIDPMEALLGKR